MQWRMLPFALALAAVGAVIGLFGDGVKTTTTRSKAHWSVVCGFLSLAGLAAANLALSDAQRALFGTQMAVWLVLAAARPPRMATRSASLLCVCPSLALAFVTAPYPYLNSLPLPALLLLALLDPEWVSFAWVTPVIVRGNLDVEDVPETFADDDTRLCVRQFQEALLERGGRLVPAFLHLHGCRYWSYGLLKFLSDMLQFCGPVLLEQLVSFLDQRDDGGSGGDAPARWKGYAFACGLVCVVFLAAVLSTQYQLLIQSLARRLRAAVIGIVFEKALRISNEERMTEDFSTGKINNIMSVDSSQLQNMVPSVHDTWSLPVQIGVALFLLYRQVGRALLGGLAVVVLLIPVNAWLTKQIQRLTREMLAAKDQRITLTDELLHNVAVVKCFAWEDLFLTRIRNVRGTEMSALRKRKYLDALCVFFWAVTPTLVSLSTFSIYEALDESSLTAAQVFTSISLFGTLVGPLNAYTWVVLGFVEGWVSVQRTQRFMDADEQQQRQQQPSVSQSRHAEKEEKKTARDEDTPLLQYGSMGAFAGNEGSYERRDAGSAAVDLVHASFGSSSSSKKKKQLLLLRDVTLSIERGRLACVTGAVGSGKSLFLLGLLGELPVSTGTVRVDSRIAYVNQEAWIMGGSVRSNILFGRPLERDRYGAVMRACALDQDCVDMPSGDLTLVDASRLSGGQRLRLALARALYSDADLFLLDDPFSALDGHVAAHVMREAIRTLLLKSGKTVVLVTHHDDLVQGADRPLWLHVVEGCVTVEPSRRRAAAAVKENRQDGNDDSDDDRKATGESDGDHHGREPEDDGDEEQEEEEFRARGTIDVSVFKEWLVSVGRGLSVFILLSLVLMQLSRNGVDVWLSHWVRALKNSDDQDSTNDYYLEGLAVVAAVSAGLTLFRAFVFAYGGLVSATRVFEKLLKSVVRAPISFFDKHPVGRLLNRFSTDTYNVDERIPFEANLLLAQCFSLLGSIAVIGYSLSFYFIAFCVPLFSIYYVLQRYYRRPSRDIRRLDSVSRSPIFTNFSEALDGVHVIRAFRAEAHFEERNLTFLHQNQRVSFTGLHAGLWLGFRLQMLGTCVVCFVSWFGVLDHSVSAAAVGLSLAYALPLTGSLNGLISSLTSTEQELVSMERIKEYMSVEPEPEPDVDAADWEGLRQRDMSATPALEMDDVSLTYENGTRALANVSLTLHLGTKAFLIGRTGSGKSSFLQVIFALRPFTGTVRVLGADVQNVPKRKLRESIGYIPQDPAIFSGSVRENLVGWGRKSNHHTEDELWAALDECSIRHKMPDSLDEPVPSKLSVGEKQLFCLARAVLRRARILCLDECTAHVDEDTDRHIQRVIRHAFADALVLTIAHRHGTIQDALATDGVVFRMDDGHLTRVLSTRTE